MKNARATSRRLRSLYTSHVESVEPRLLMSTYTVNTISDAVQTPAGQLTLRQAVKDANAHAGADTIVFSSSVFGPGALHTILLTQGQINFTDTSGATTITGPGESKLAINGNKVSRIFQIYTDATVFLSGATVTGGRATVEENSVTQGGGILNMGNLTISNSILTGNSVIASGYTYDENFDQYDPSNAEGGAICSSGPLTITNSTVSNNIAECDPPSNIVDNSESANAWGGGISASEVLALGGDTIIDNKAIGGSGSAGGQASGGGVAMTTDSPASIKSCNIDRNMAIGGNSQSYLETAGSASGGGVSISEGLLDISGSTIDGNSIMGGTSPPESLFLSESSGFAIGGGVDADGTLRMTNCHVDSNIATAFQGLAQPGGEGGGIGGGPAMNITASTINDNTATGNGGGIYFVGGIDASAMLLVQDSTVSGNTIAAVPAQVGYDNAGGGIYSSSTTVINDSSITGNIIKGGAAEQTSETPLGVKSISGAGIYNDAAMTVINSTVADNSLTGGPGNTYSQYNGEDAFGAGICSQPNQNEGFPTYLTIQDSTVTRNAAYGGKEDPAYTDSNGDLEGKSGTADGGGVYAATGTVVENSIISANNSASGADVYSALSAVSSHNLIGYGGGLINGVQGNIIGVHNPRLMPLGWYGGPTETMPPLPASPVVDAGSNSLLPSGLTTDQRGDPRISGKAVDIGAVEFGNVTLTGTVFNDRYASGKFQTGDNGIPGFTVFLDLNHDGIFDAGDISTVTNSYGQYTFDGLFAGTYAVDVGPENGFRPTTTQSATVNAKANSTITIPAFGQTQDALATGSVLLGKSSLANVRVFVDLTGTGKFVPGDPSTLTNSAGLFSLNIALPGIYRLRILPTSSHRVSTPNAGFYTLIVGKASIRSGLTFIET